MLAGETSERDDVGGGDGPPAADSASGERRPSLDMLLNTARRVSQSPFHNPLQVSSSDGHTNRDKRRETSTASFDSVFVPSPDFQTSSPGFETQSKSAENGSNVFDPQKGLVQDPNTSKQGPFQTSTLPNNSSANYCETLNSPNLSNPFSPQAQSPPKTWQPQRSDQFKDVFQADKGEDSLRTEALFDKSPSAFVNPFKSPSNKEDPFWSQWPTAANSSDTAATNAPDLFQAVPTKSEQLSRIGEKRFPSVTDDPFGTSSKMNLFLPESTKRLPSFSSAISRDLFPDISTLDDPSRATPSKQNDASRYVSNGTPDIFQPLPWTTTNKDAVEKSPSDVASRFSFSPHSVNSVTDMRPDMPPPSPDLFKAPEAEPKSSDTPGDAFETQETKQSILQPTPFTRARNLCVSPGQSPPDMTHVSTFKRPPKPLPRKRQPRKVIPPLPGGPLMSEPPPLPGRPLISEPPPLPGRPLISEPPPLPGRPLMSEPPPLPGRPLTSEPPPLPGRPVVPEKPPTPDKSVEPKPAVKPPPKPVVPHTPKTPESKLAEPEDSYVLQEILLIGQEICVEDWPEDSPELQPDFKPSGKFRLRRESMLLKMDSSGGSGEDQDPYLKKKDKKLRMSLLSRRSSKGKFSDDAKEWRSMSLPAQYRTGMSQDGIPGAHGYTPYTACQAAVLEEEAQCKSAGLNAAPWDADHRKPKKLTKKKHGRRQSFNMEPLDSSPLGMKSSCSAEELDSVELNGVEDRRSKKSKHKRSGLLHKSKSPDGQSDRTPAGACSDAFAEDDDCHTARDFTSPGELGDGQLDDFEARKPKKTSKLKGIKLHKSKKKNKDPAGATPISEATREAWQLAQIDERADDDLENGEEDGDTDSLMEWWYTVEQWDELPSDDEDGIVQEDDSEAFTVLANKVTRGLRVFNRVFTERAEHLWQYITTLHATADDLKNFHKKALVAGITGGTTTAVGGVTAITGLALAPFTLGFSLILTVVGMGVATAGGITSASAAISDNVNNIQDSKKVEVILQDYETHLLDISKVLHFIDQGIYRLRGHPFLRSGTQHYSQDWEIRRAVQIISLVDSPVRRAVEITDTAVTSVQGLFKGMDKYFTKDSRELKKGCNAEVVGRIKLVADILHRTLVELNSIRNGVEEAAGGL